ncbi:MAG: transferrin receptor-like dimerization domain-containing protein, partial [Caulobacteraceae bacterium]
EAAAGGDLPVGDMGSGSDYTPFVQHLGIASMNIGYGGEGQSGGVYHSAYDTFEHFERFGDPGFIYGVTLAKTGGRLMLRMADAEILPFQFGDVAASLAEESAQLKKLATTSREKSQATDRALEARAFALAADPTLPWGPPEREEAAPAIDFSSLDAAIAALGKSARAYDLAATTATPDAGRLARVNVILQGAEQSLTDPRGLPGRPWYRHLIYAPGLLTGYGAKTLPGVREAIESRRWSEVPEYMDRTAAVVRALSAKIDEATALLSR